MHRLALVAMIALAVVAAACEGAPASAASDVDMQGVERRLDEAVSALTDISAKLDETNAKLEGLCELIADLPAAQARVQLAARFGGLSACATLP